ncbi:hypothetical protein L596_020341 [Steinernema carpocapsae]|uniref:Uncharacterized protein n=1 Tax=Steinernema carpocapsae TaxID=34508 RepID=A0A4U5MU10_STECR|nr:hypothetical protein L596_020341 [Steinernema carpocapsae]
MYIAPSSKVGIARLPKKQSRRASNVSLKRIAENVIFVLPQRFSQKETRISIDGTFMSGPDDFAPMNRQHQPVTRTLAFGGYEGEAKKKASASFYSNSTLTTVAKIFSVIIITVVFVLLMRRVVVNYQVVE